MTFIDVANEGVYCESTVYLWTENHTSAKMTRHPVGGNLASSVSSVNFADIDTLINAVHHVCL